MPEENTQQNPSQSADDTQPVDEVVDAPQSAADVESLPDYAVGTDPIFIDSDEDREMIDAMINDAIEYGDHDALYDIFVQLGRLVDEAGSKFQKENPELYAHHQRNLARALVPVLERATPEDVQFVLREHTDLLDAMDLEEIMRKLRVGLMTQPDLEHRDKIKQEYRRAIRGSQAIIGSKPLTIGAQQLDPTIEHWFMDWRDFLGERDPEALLVVEYLNSGANVRQLKEQERDLLEKVLRIHTAFKYSSLTPEGNETPVMFMDPETGTYHIYQAGEARDTGVPVPEDELQILREGLGYDKDGKAMSVVELVKNSETFRRYALPNTVPAAEQDAKDEERANAAIVETDTAAIEEIEQMAKVANEAVVSEAKEEDVPPQEEPAPTPAPTRDTIHQRRRRDRCGLGAG